MSSHLYVYIGPFFMVPKQKMKSETREYKCSSVSCGRKAESRREAFCSKCGSPLVDEVKEVMVEDYPHPSDFGPKFESELQHHTMSDGTVVWMPTQCGIGMTVSRDSETVTAMTSEDVNQATRRFVGENFAIVRAFQAKYGVEPIEVWGVVPYFS